ncbi:MAG: GntR family transcriptional regulator [Clostridiales bacterium]|nr:GntR family transcriptional regulator [Clostridiales bacterium]
MKDISLHMDEYLPLRDVVFNTLREAILTGDLEPGERLMEIKLADKLGVSRTPIREAIRKLELEGLVNMTPRKGAVVAEISKEDLQNVLEVRRVLEQLAVELACKRMCPEDEEALETNLEVFKKAIETNNPTDIAKLDVEFHDIIYMATKNARLIQILFNIREQMYRYRLEYIKDQDTRYTVVKDHAKIIAALKDKKVEEAKKIIISHIEQQEKTIKKNMGFN